MASELDVLLDKVDDPALRADLRRQVELLRSKRRFGLVFEEHLPERVQLPDHTVRRGHERGSRRRLVLGRDTGDGMGSPEGHPEAVLSPLGMSSTFGPT